MYKCHICQKNFNNGITMMSICYICEAIVCGNCYHGHSLDVGEIDESLRQLVKDKGKLAFESCLNLFNFDSLGYPHHNFDNNTIDFAQIERNREMIKPYRGLCYMGIYDFKAFFQDLLQFKRKFLYQLYKMFLLKKFCYDIAEMIVDYL